MPKYRMVNSPEWLWTCHTEEPLYKDKEQNMEDILREFDNYQERIKSKNSFLVFASFLKLPFIADVTIDAPYFFIPLKERQECSATITTPTPSVFNTSSKVSAICLVILSLI